MNNCLTAISTLSPFSPAIIISMATEGGGVVVILGAGGLPNSRVTVVVLNSVSKLRLLLPRLVVSDTILKCEKISDFM